jgi:putative endonuclease
LLISEEKRRTYVGFSDNLRRRFGEHASGEVKTTKNFGNFDWKILEQTNDVRLAREAEKYWKSAAGRKRIKDVLKKNDFGPIV